MPPGRSGPPGVPRRHRRRPDPIKTGQAFLSLAPQPEGVEILRIEGGGENRRSTPGCHTGHIEVAEALVDFGQGDQERCRIEALALPGGLQQDESIRCDRRARSASPRSSSARAWSRWASAVVLWFIVHSPRAHAATHLRVGKNSTGRNTNRLGDGPRVVNGNPAAGDGPQVIGAGSTACAGSASGWGCCWWFSSCSPACPVRAGGGRRSSRPRAQVRLRVDCGARRGCGTECRKKQRIPLVGRPVPSPDNNVGRSGTVQRIDTWRLPRTGGRCPSPRRARSSTSVLTMITEDLTQLRVPKPRPCHAIREDYSRFSPKMQANNG